MANSQTLQTIFQNSPADIPLADHAPELERQGRLTGSREMPSTAVVKGRDDLHSRWKENAKVISLTGSGAGFLLERECEVGCLVSLMIALPIHMRSYDKEKKLYRVWGVVQHCYPVSGIGGNGFNVGVAFIGKNAPDSYNDNPLQSYRIVGMDHDGLWRVTEAASQFRVRRSPRFWNSLPVTLFSLDAEGNSTANDKCFTENISETGASLITYLAAAVGDPVKLLCDSPPFSSLAVVRNTSAGKDEKPRLHIEFVEEMFPITELSSPIEQDVKH